MTRYIRHIFTIFVCFAAMLATPGPSHAIDFYEIQIYDTERRRSVI